MNNWILRNIEKNSSFERETSYSLPN